MANVTILVQRTSQKRCNYHLCYHKNGSVMLLKICAAEARKMIASGIPYGS